MFECFRNAGRRGRFGGEDRNAHLAHAFSGKRQSSGQTFVNDRAEHPFLWYPAFLISVLDSVQEVGKRVIPGVRCLSPPFFPS